MNIPCPRCGRRSDITLTKTEDGRSYVIICEQCKTKVYIPCHPFLEMGVDLTKSTIDTGKKFKDIYDLLRVVLKRKQ